MKKEKEATTARRDTRKTTQQLGLETETEMGKEEGMGRADHRQSPRDGVTPSPVLDLALARAGEGADVPAPRRTPGAPHATRETMGTLKETTGKDPVLSRATKATTSR